ncbi:MAG: SUMF1/EgtB/PvdO family nonheme iron enzyme [Verrucomicrobiota bacterium]
MKSFYPSTLAFMLSTSALLSQTPGDAPQKFNAAEAIATVKKPYVEGRQKLEADFERAFTQVQSGYLASLDKLQADTAKTGDLDAVLVIKSERDRVAKRFKTTAQQVMAMPGPLKTLRENFDGALNKLLENGVKLDTDLRAKCVGELEVLQKRVTIAGYIEQAIEVKKEKERFAAEKPGVVVKPIIVQAEPQPMVQRPASGPAENITLDELWESRYNVPEALPQNGGWELKDGWLVRGAASKFGTLWLGNPMADAAIRAEFRWPRNGAIGNLNLGVLNSEQVYALGRHGVRGVELTFNNVVVGQFPAPSPKLDDSFRLELRKEGSVILAKLDSKEIIRVDDAQVRGVSEEVFIPRIYVSTGAVRNIESLKNPGKHDINAFSDLVKRLEAKLLPVPATDVFMSKTEFTVGEWRLYSKARGFPEWQSPKELVQTDEHPVVEVSWNEAKSFCDWLSARTGKEWRLPTEKEFEAAVGGTKYPWGDYYPPHWDDGNYGMLDDGRADPQKVGIDGIFGTAPVGSFKPNTQGFYDLGGNVQEYAWDGIDPKGKRVCRGGSWFTVSPQSSSSSNRAPAESRSRSQGFRIVQGKFPGKLTAPPPPEIAPEVKPPSSPTAAERWEPKLQRVEDHPATGDSELREGWVMRKVDAKPLSREVGNPMTTGAVRAEFRWPASGNSGSLSLRNGEHGYFLERDRSGVVLRFENIEVGRFNAPTPKPNDPYKLELRMSGKMVVAFFDGKEVIRVDDDLRPENTTLAVTPTVNLQDAAVRNIEVLVITPADAPKK